MRVELVHDWLTVLAGSERVLAAMAAVYPDAPIHTLVHDPRGTAGTVFAERDIRTSFTQRLPLARTRYRAYLPLMPFAVEQLDVSDAEAVVSSHHAVAHGVVTRADQLHVAYMHTPVRYAWDLYHEHDRELRGLKRWAARGVLHYLRLWDQTAAQRVDRFFANSKYVANRVWKRYRRRAEVIYPPVDVERFTPADHRDDFYLHVGRLVPYKRVDVVVEAFRQLDRPLVVIGDGPQRKRIEKRAGPNVTFRQGVDDAGVAAAMGRCRALVFAAEEDFGIVPVEAMAAGAPVIGYARGGLLETVEAGKTGVFFDQRTPEAVAAAVRGFEAQATCYHPGLIREHAQRFAKDRFTERFHQQMEIAWRRFRTRQGR